MPRYGLTKQPTNFFFSDGVEGHDWGWVATAVITDQEAETGNYTPDVFLGMCRNCISMLCEAEGIRLPQSKMLDEVVSIYCKILVHFITRYLRNHAENGRILDWFSLNAPFFDDRELNMAFTMVPLLHLDKPDVAFVLRAFLSRPENPVQIEPTLYWMPVNLPLGFSGVFGDENQERKITSIVMGSTLKHYWKLIREAYTNQTNITFPDMRYSEFVSQVNSHIAQADSLEAFIETGYLFRPIYVDGQSCIVSFYKKGNDSGVVYTMLRRLGDDLNDLHFYHKPDEPIRRLVVNKYLGPNDLWLAITGSQN